ncbi:MAG: DUF4270 family protein [Cyclobacteriaceae bacterium]
MNLWGRVAGLCALFAAILWGCQDDESSFLGFRNPNLKFSVIYQEIEVPSTVMSFDSVRTYNNPAIPFQDRTVLVGRYADPLLGEISAEMYTQIRPTTPTVDIPAEARFVTCSFILSPDFRFYGSENISSVTFSLHELTDSIRSSINTDLLPPNVRGLPTYLPYYFNSSISYDPTPLGSTVYEVEPATFAGFRGLLDNPTSSLTPNNLDSLVIKVADSYGEALFNAAKSQTDEYKRFSLFKRIFKGFAVVPSSTDSKILHFNPENDPETFSKSRLIVEYNQFNDELQVDERKVLEYTFYEFADNSVYHINFTRIQADRSATVLGALTTPNVEIEPIDNKRYYQSGNPVTTKVDFSKFLEFTDTIPNLIFNSVELSIEVEDFDNLEPPATLRLRLLNENNDFLNFFSQDIEEANTPVFGRSMTYDEEGWFIIGQRLNAQTVGNLFDINYDSETHSYRGDLTDFFQSLAAVDNQDQLFLNFAFVASDLPLPLSVNRAVFKKENIKLKIFYTIPTSEDPK